MSSYIERIVEMICFLEYEEYDYTSKKSRHFYEQILHWYLKGRRFLRDIELKKQIQSRDKIESLRLMFRYVQNTLLICEH